MKLEEKKDRQCPHCGYKTVANHVARFGKQSCPHCGKIKLEKFKIMKPLFVFGGKLGD